MFCLGLVLGFFKEKNNYNQQMLLELKGKSLISLSGMTQLSVGVYSEKPWI